MGGVLRYSLAAMILALGMTVSSMLLSRFFVRVKHEEQISVKGYAEAPIVSDMGELEVRVNVRGERRDKAYQLLTSQVNDIVAKVKQSAPDDLKVGTGNPRFDEVYKRDSEGNRTNEVEFHTGSQTVSMASSDVRWVERTGKDLNALIGEGYDIKVYAPTYLVSRLDDIKRRLLEQATADGYRRAQLMAKNSGARVGSLRAARQGVFQITEPNSTETSGYGLYDTSTIAKSIKAVVTLEYDVQ